MKLLGTRQLSVMLVGTLLLCHGALGALHLVCYPPSQCASDAEHAAEHQPAAGAAGDAHEHPAGHHGTSTEYFAVVVSLLGLLLRLLPKGAAGLQTWLGVRRASVLRWVSGVFRPPPTPTPRILQVFRL
jgi:hypothetical protein